MLFNSLQYIAFFIIVVSFYFAIPHRFRWIFLLAASYYFYMCWNPKYILLIITSTLVAYYTGILMGKEQAQDKRRKYLILSLVANLGLLVVFKYFNFFNENLRELFNYFNIFYGIPAFNLLLPVGISFYTFQTLSYSIDIYRDERAPEKSLGIFALYVSFFPQLVAGPIERSTNLLPQFFEKKEFDYDRVTSGLKIMAWGMFKKVVIADRLAVVVNQVYGSPEGFTGVTILIATFFFAYQIYCDFSGYTDIAIGTARVLGFELMANFKRPYFAGSIREFWQRWHISLSTWFRDYLYIPLGGNRVNRLRHYTNLTIVFLICGLWHGASWTFVIWGGIHGFYMIFSRITGNLRSKAVTLSGLGRFPKFHQLFKTIVTFILVCFAWVFFRANNLEDAIHLIRNSFIGLGSLILNIMDIAYVRGVLRPLDISQTEMAISIILIIFLELVHLLQEINISKIKFKSLPMWARWAAYYVLTLGFLLFGSFNSGQDFIYFQF
jgi:alginate O-acetyltransferase complex protein AlgI